MAGNSALKKTKDNASINKSLKSLAANFYSEGIQKLVTISGWTSVETMWKSSVRM